MTNRPGFVFDLDGTLYASSAEVEPQIKPLYRRHAAETLGMTIPDVTNLLAKYRHEYTASVIGLARNHDIDPDALLDNVYRDIDLSRIKPRPGLASQITRLSDHADLYLMTNSARIHARRVIRLLGIDDVFQQVFTTETFGCLRKPDPRVYSLLLNNIPQPPDRVTFFDDSYLNLVVANEKGAGTVLVSNGVSPPGLFWEMHRGIAAEAPDFVEAAVDDLGAYLATLLCE